MTKSLGRAGWMAVVVGVAMVSLGGVVARAQDVAPSTMMAKDADPDWEVATVKPSDMESSNSGFHSRGGRMQIQHRTVKDMLIIGYGMHEKQLVGMPGLFTAVQEQMGLRMEPVKAKTDVLVIDKIERPSGN